LPALETMIAASVVVGGSLLVFGRKFSLTQGLTLGAIFALIHGYAHGQEIGTALTIPYFAGFVTGFLLLASSAMAVGHLAGRRRLSQWMRPAGVGFVCMGGLFLSGVL
jgi:urease accessory protein